MAPGDEPRRSPSTTDDAPSNGVYDIVAVLAAGAVGVTIIALLVMALGLLVRDLPTHHRLRITSRPQTRRPDHERPRRQDPPSVAMRGGCCVTALDAGLSRCREV